MPTQWSTANQGRQCERCGTAVSQQFVRVFGLDDGVHGCIDCMTRTELSEGMSAIPAGERGDDEEPERPALTRR